MNIQASLNNGRLISLIPISEIEHEAINQLDNVLSQEEVLKVAVMPDIHAGYTLPVGCAALTKGVISPQFVGTDIGCGMSNITFGHNGKMPTKKKIQDFLDIVTELVPVGFSRRDSNSLTVDEKLIKKVESLDISKDIKKEILSDMFTSIGTLGGGNHFIELGMNQPSEGESHLMGVTVHSGSRHVGTVIFDMYKNGRLFLDITSDSGKLYYQLMKIAEEFAYENRKNMMRLIFIALGRSKICGGYSPIYDINETHNHAILLPNNEVLHRKGATPAEYGQMGVIPANSRDGVYITSGLGAGEYLETASHGCGRSMSRSKAKKSFNADDYEKQMNGIAINGTFIDEIPSAYKSADYVIKNQHGITVEVKTCLKPIAVVKG